MDGADDMDGADTEGDEQAEADEREYSNDEMTSRVVIEDLRLSGGDDDDDDGPNTNMFAVLASSRTANATEKSQKPGFATPNDSHVKPAAKRFTYENKAARRAESLKQKSRRMEKADASKSRRGGKTGRGVKISAKKRGGKR